MLPFRKPTQKDRNGEILEGLSGSESVARRNRDVEEPGRPHGLPRKEGRVYQRKKAT